MPSFSSFPCRLVQAVRPALIISWDRCEEVKLTIGGSSVFLRTTQLRSLRDRISKHLGDATAAPANDARPYPAKLVEAVRKTAQDCPASLQDARRPIPAHADLPLVRLLRAAVQDGLLPEPQRDLAGYMSPCPIGYGTVLGHLVQRGEFPEDMGREANRRLSEAAEREGVVEVWVRPSPALASVYDRVRAYPAEFLARHLGKVEKPWKAAS